MKGYRKEPTDEEIFKRLSNFRDPVEDRINQYGGVIGQSTAPIQNKKTKDDILTERFINSGLGTTSREYEAEYGNS